MKILVLGDLRCAGGHVFEKYDVSKRKIHAGFAKLLVVPQGQNVVEYVDFFHCVPPPKILGPIIRETHTILNREIRIAQ